MIAIGGADCSIFCPERLRVVVEELVLKRRSFGYVKVMKLLFFLARF